MATSRKQLWPQDLPTTVRPIKYVTENGFSIVRLCDLDEANQNSPSDCGFLVTRDEGRSREIHVSFARELVAELRERRRFPLSDESVFWLVCAESCLATHLWDSDDFPSNGHLAIEQLSPEELMLALHWRD
jgi:hypothetical protein